jgi:hypothetical protein
VADNSGDDRPAVDGLDSTIDQLELLLESKQELLSSTSSRQSPPAGAVLPVLADKIVNIDALKFGSPATPHRAPLDAANVSEPTAEGGGRRETFT